MLVLITLSKRCRYGKAFDVVGDTQLRSLLTYGRRTLLVRDGTSYQKTGRAKNLCSCPHYFSLPHLLGSHALYDIQL